MDDLHNDLAAHVADELADDDLEAQVDDEIADEMTREFFGEPADGGQLAPLSEARLAEILAANLKPRYRDAITALLAERERLLAVVRAVANCRETDWAHDDSIFFPGDVSAAHVVEQARAALAAAETGEEDDDTEHDVCGGCSEIADFDLDLCDCCGELLCSDCIEAHEAAAQQLKSSGREGGGAHDDT